MKLEDQSASLESAKRLKELGVKQSSLFYHIVNSISEIRYEGCKMREDPIDGGVIRYYSAFTVAELGVLLPAGYDTMYTTGEGWRCYDHDGNDFQVEAFKTEAECRAEMLIHLLQRNIITAEECNKRLIE